MNETTASRRKTLDMVYIAMFSIVIAICSWISVPATVPFTMQTFAVFMAVGTLGGKRGTLAVVLYIILGAIGLPVFAGFSGGVGVLFGTTGGYIAGFVFSALIMWAMEKASFKNIWWLGFSMVVGLIVCYIFGTAWFMAVYAKTTGEIGLLTALGWCVFPYIIPDLLKITLALILCPRIKKFIK